MAASTTTEAVWTLKAGLRAAAVSGRTSVSGQSRLLLTRQTGPALFHPPTPTFTGGSMTPDRQGVDFPRFNPPRAAMLLPDIFSAVAVKACTPQRSA